LDPIQWTCTWNNPSFATVYPGGTSTDEMCIAYAGFYPRNTREGAVFMCNNYF
jgi:hypothetical protein